MECCSVGVKENWGDETGGNSRRRADPGCARGCAEARAALWHAAKAEGNRDCFSVCSCKIRRVRFHVHGEAIALHLIQRKTGEKVAGNLVGNGVVEYWSDGAVKQEVAEKRRKKVPCPDLAPGLVPAIAFVLLPMPTRSRTPIQQTSSAVPNRSPDRRPSRIMRSVGHGLAGKTSVLFSPTRRQLQGCESGSSGRFRPLENSPTTLRRCTAVVPARPGDLQPHGILICRPITRSGSGLTPLSRGGYRPPLNTKESGAKDCGELLILWRVSKTSLCRMPNQRLLRYS
jgi:hypothetical protein